LFFGYAVPAFQHACLHRNTVCFVLIKKHVCTMYNVQSVVLKRTQC